ncbi:radical SAM family heme chaperone HemW [Nigerium massiliense]|uniref:radical SAM family heme chaperone HemW n=1 Tax=Nigerium massiliense TaxID=1522317 RepID=UPI00058DC09B|nr:radical SAM family heme chaperone HemW [Nigerium massiliense]
MSPGSLPEGEPVPEDGALPPSARAELSSRGLSAYVHVPFCVTRCGYCDFNTYTAAELGAAPGDSQESYLRALDAEVALARRVLGDGAPPLQTIFFGGGTPTVLAPEKLGAVVAGLRDAFGLADDAEVTTEANPDSVTPEALRTLVEAGVNRISFGMQSSQEHVLSVLDRTHTPGRALEAVRWAREAGFASVSLDLIYGTPGESLDDWRASLDAALGAEPDHVSAYSLIVEDGTPLARRVRRGELPMPDEDDLADKYVLADDALSGAGYRWYEVSNWAKPGHECRHNLAYWVGDSWWGFGPGAHSHVGGVRFWNVKHPRRYAQLLAHGRTPAAGREVLTPGERREERVLLELRLDRGLPLDVLTVTERRRVPEVVARGLGTLSAGDERLVLTRRGRLLADAVIRDLLD